MPLHRPEADTAGADRDAPYETESRHPATAHLPDLEHPWLGLESFREDTRAYFFGRDAEIGELHLRLRSHPLLVLYGRSGLGKTSILTAGLIPRLVSEEKRPLLVRLRYDDPALDPAGQLVAAVFGWGECGGGPRLTSRPTKSLPWAVHLGEKLAVSMPVDYPSRLWLRLHYRREPPDVTHLIVDQFEEVFTLGAQIPAAESSVRDAMSILLQGAIPEPITQLIAENDSFLDEFDPDSVPVRVILALRDDYVYALHRWSRHLASLGQNNFELRALRGGAAFDAVFKPGELRSHYRSEITDENRIDTGLPPIIDADTAERIVRFVAKKGPDASMEMIEAVPPILSLLCRELNERRFGVSPDNRDAAHEQIKFFESDANIETIIAAFYERCLAGRPEAVRVFIEDGMVSYSGARLAQDEQSIIRVFENGTEISGAPDNRRADGFGDSNAARACLYDLINRRLLSPLGDQRYELIHDLLASVVEKSRTARTERLRLERDAAALRARQERAGAQAAEQQARRKQRQLLTVAAALIVAVTAAVGSILQYKRATHARVEAEKLIEFMTLDLRDKLAPIGRLSLLHDIDGRIEAYYESLTGREKSPELLRLRGVMLRNRGDVQRAQGDLTGALKSYENSLDIAQKLAWQAPSNTEWQSDLAISYENVGHVERAQGDLSQALRRYAGSLGIRQMLASQQPGNVDWQRDLVLSYNNVGDLLRAQGDLTGALTNYSAGLALAERLGQHDPSNADWQQNLSLTYNNIGGIQCAQGDLRDALISYRAGHTIAQRLAQQDPSNATWQRNLSLSYNKIGDVESARGDLQDALISYRAGHAIAQRLAQQDPSNATWQRNLSLSYNNIGDIQSARGDLQDALTNYSAGLALAERLAQQDPSNADWQQNLSLSYNNIGDIHTARGELRDALISYRAGHAIAQRLAQQDPSNATWQRTLSLSYNRIGDGQVAQRDLRSALSSYREGLVIAERLERQDPSNAAWKGHLLLSYNKIGRVQSALGDLASALSSYRAGLNIAEQLVQRDSRNPLWQVTVALYRLRTGTILARAEPKAKDEARALVATGRDILKQFRIANSFTGSDEELVAFIEHLLETKDGS
jgi:tetratricopeptide (TPR) repeat protein